MSVVLQALWERIFETLPILRVHQNVKVYQKYMIFFTLRRNIYHLYGVYINMNSIENSYIKFRYFWTRAYLSVVTHGHSSNCDTCIEEYDVADINTGFPYLVLYHYWLHLYKILLKFVLKIWQGRCDPAQMRYTLMPINLDVLKNIREYMDCFLCFELAHHAVMYWIIGDLVDKASDFSASGYALI